MSLPKESFFPADLPADAQTLKEAFRGPDTAPARPFFAQPDLAAETPTLRDLGETRRPNTKGEQISFHTPDFPGNETVHHESTPVVHSENGHIGFGQLPAREPAPLYPKRTTPKR